MTQPEQTVEDISLEVRKPAHQSWEIVLAQPGRSTLRSYLLAGSVAAMLLDPGPMNSWPIVRSAVADIVSGLDVPLIAVASHSDGAHAGGALDPACTDLATPDQQVQILTVPAQADLLAHSANDEHFWRVDSGEVVDLGERTLRVSVLATPCGGQLLQLLDSATGFLFDGSVLELRGPKPLPEKFEEVRRDAERVLLATLAPNALEGQLLAALSPVLPVAAMRTYVQPEGESWLEIGGPAGLGGRQTSEPRLTGDRVLAVDFHVVGGGEGRVCFRLRSGAAHLLDDPAIAQLVEALRPVLAAAARRLLTMRSNQLEAAQLHRDSHRDPLTGAWNRRALERAEEIGAKAVLLIDLDHFKQVNDQLGHGAGDTVLQRVAQTLLQQIRDHDMLIRYGGDEFLVVLHGVGHDIARRVADRLRNAIEALQLGVAADRPAVTASIGVAAGDDVPLAKLVHDADEAMYRAKQGGRNAVDLAK